MTLPLLIVEYDPRLSGLKCVLDGEAGDYAKGIVEDAANGSHILLMTGQQLVVDYVRLYVKRGLIPPDQVEFWFKKEKIYVDKNGHLDHWPEGFCDFGDKILTELIDFNDEQPVARD